MLIKKKPVQIRQVWSHNLLYEFKLINSILAHYPFVSMDTEFPGVIYRPSTGNPVKDKTIIQNMSPFAHYCYLKENVDALKLIQVGLTFSDAHGNLPDFGTEKSYIWEFNFRDFDIYNDNYAVDSIDLLKKQGIDFDKNRRMGIDSAEFAWCMIKTGLVCNSSSITWITFHSGYDFAYLIKILTRRSLPDHLYGFMGLVHWYFGSRVYDIKYMMKFCNKSLGGGLEKVAKTLDVNREVGKCHQAGSDSLLTLKTFMKMNSKFFRNHNIHQRYGGIIYGFQVS